MKRDKLKATKRPTSPERNGTIYTAYGFASIASCCMCIDTTFFKHFATAIARKENHIPVYDELRTMLAVDFAGQLQWSSLCIIYIDLLGRTSFLLL